MSNAKPARGQRTSTHKAKAEMGKLMNHRSTAAHEKRDSGKPARTKKHKE